MSERLLQCVDVADELEGCLTKLGGCEKGRASAG